MPRARLLRAALPALLLSAAWAAPLAGQAVDGGIAPRGVVRLDVAGWYTHADRRFGADEREPLGAWYRDALRAAAAVEAAPVEAQLRDFFAGAAGAPPLGAGEVTLGEAQARVQASTRHVPFRLAVGIVPRAELTLLLPLERDELLVQRFGFTGGTLGANPNPTANAAVLRRAEERWGSLGAAAYLPISASPLGRALQARVQALTGDTLLLPTAGVGTTVLAQLADPRVGPAPPPGGLRPWRVGDLEVGGRVLLLSTFGTASYPAEPAGLELRLAAGGAVRLPTGRQVEEVDAFTMLPAVGRGGLRAGVDGDLFLGRRFWLNGDAGLVRLEQASAAGADPLQVVVWSPASELAFRLAPRYRLTDAIALGATYRAAHASGSTVEMVDPAGGFALGTPAGTVQQAGVEARYSTLPALAAIPRTLRGPFALEVGLTYLHPISGPAGVPAGRTIVLEGSLLHRVWGR